MQTGEVARFDNNELFRLLVESVKDYAIFLLDESGIVRSWNVGAERIKGYKAEEIIGQHFSKFYPPDDRGVCAGLLQTALREGRVRSYGWRVRKDGSQFWANVVITALLDSTGKHVGFAKVTRDMTEGSYRLFVEATNSIVWTTDASGVPSADSPGWRAFTGQTVAEWRNLNGWEPVHPEDREQVVRGWDVAKAERRLFDTEFRLRRHDGVYVWMGARAVPFLNADGSVREWFGVTFDVSARRQAESELAAALDRERALRVEAERVGALWTTTLRSIGDAVIATDVNGQVAFMNAAAERLTGVSAPSASGRPLAEIFPLVEESSRKPVDSPVARVLREGTTVELVDNTLLARSDGVDIPILDSAAPIRDAAGGLLGVVMVFRDATNERRAATRKEFLGNVASALTATSDSAEAIDTMVKLAVPRFADWCAVDVIEPGEKMHRQIAVAHADPRKLELVRRMAERYAPDPNATSGVPNVIRTGRSELHPLIPQEVLEAAAIDDEHLRVIRQLSLRSAIVVPLRGRDRVFGALTFVYAESGRRYAEDDLAFAEELAQRAAAVIERRKLEEERAAWHERERAARAEAELASRAKDEFLAIVSHELRNPLSTILGWARLLSQKDLPPEVLKHIATIERNARAQARLIEDVLELSRIISGKLRLDLAEASVAHAVADAVEAVRQSVEKKGIALDVNLEPGISIRADQVRLQQIIGNLVSNAVKFTPKGGRVSLDARIVGEWLRVEVTDTGEGIEPEKLSLIFEPFRQADGSTTRRHGGLGLGLAIVRRLAEAHGGSVRAESHGKGKGATFCVELPARLHSERPAAPPLFAAAYGAETLESIRVLVVDDDPDAVELMRELLTDAGAIVETARSAREALEKLPRAKPAILISDIGMAEQDGYGLIRAVRELDPSSGGRIPAVAITAYTRREDVEDALSAGFQAHLPKPVDASRLVATVARLTRVARPALV